MRGATIKIRNKHFDFFSLNIHYKIILNNYELQITGEVMVVVFTRNSYQRQ